MLFIAINGPLGQILIRLCRLWYRRRKDLQFTKEYIYFSLFFQWQYTNLNYGWYLMLLPRFISALNIESIHVFVYDWEEWFVFKVHVWMCWNANFDLSRFPEGWEIYCTYPFCIYLYVGMSASICKKALSLGQKRSNILFFFCAIFTIHVNFALVCGFRFQYFQR